MVLEHDKLKEAEELEMESDSVDSKLALSAMLERLAARDRARAPICTSDAKKRGSDAELESQLQSKTEVKKKYEDVGISIGPSWASTSVSGVSSGPVQFILQLSKGNYRDL